MSAQELTITEWEAVQAKIAPIRSRRMKIITALQQVLFTITTGRGYVFDIKDVRTDAKSWRDVSAPETPIVFIIDDMVQIMRYAGKTRTYTWTIKLFGVVKETSLAEFEEFIADIEECIEINNSLAGAVNKAEINQVITDNQMFDNTNTRLFEMDINCEYVRCLGNPR